MPTARAADAAASVFSTLKRDSPASVIGTSTSSTSGSGSASGRSTETQPSMTVVARPPAASTSRTAGESGSRENTQGCALTTRAHRVDPRVVAVQHRPAVLAGDLRDDATSPRPAGRRCRCRAGRGGRRRSSERPVAVFASGEKQREGGFLRRQKQADQDDTGEFSAPASTRSRSRRSCARSRRSRKRGFVRSSGLAARRRRVVARPRPRNARRGRAPRVHRRHRARRAARPRRASGRSPGHPPGVAARRGSAMRGQRMGRRLPRSSPTWATSGRRRTRPPRSPRSGPNERVIVAEVDGAVRGFASAAVVPFFNDGSSRLRLTAIAVSPSYRGRGLARSLVA